MNDVYAASYHSYTYQSSEHLIGELGLAFLEAVPRSNDWTVLIVGFVGEGGIFLLWHVVCLNDNGGRLSDLATVSTTYYDGL